MNTTTSAQTCFHLSLDVRDLAASVAFYRDLFGVAPDKQRKGYARFTLAAPPLVFSLVESTGAVASTGRQRVSHLGFRVDSAEALETARERLTATGRPLRDETAARCCYALQDKFWITDPDGNEWEFYRFLEDLPTMGKSSGSCCT
ncbi:MAG: ArsI/CadI family heavy metal resistance metalloenzyme [Planctomycetota bacterium]